MHPQEIFTFSSIYSFVDGDANFAIDIPSIKTVLCSMNLNVSSSSTEDEMATMKKYPPMCNIRVTITAKSGTVSAMPFVYTGGTLRLAGTIPSGQIHILAVWRYN